MISWLRLRNFKTFRDEKVTFGPVSIVLGANGAGKSNLFDALRFLRAIGEGRSVRDAVEGHISPGTSMTTVAGIRGGASTVTHFLSNSSVFTLNVQAKIHEDTLDYSVSVDVKRYTVVHEELRSRGHPSSYVYSTKPDTDPLEQDEESPIIVARFFKETRGRNPRRNFSRSDFILTQFVSRRAESKVNEDRSDMLRDEFMSLQPLELRPDVLRQYSALGRTELGEHGENFAAVVWSLVAEAEPRTVRRRRNDEGRMELVVSDEPNEAQLKLDSINEWLSELTPRSVVAIGTDRAPTGEVIFSVTEEGIDQQIAAPSLSDGTLRFAALAVAAVGAQGRQTLVIEELENGVNPSRLSLLVKMIEQTAQAGGEVQAIASTHSPAVLDYADSKTVDDSIVIGWDHDKMSSRPMRLSRLPSLNEAKNHRTLGELQAEGWLQFAADA